MAPLAALEANPIANAVAVVSLEDVAKSGGQVSLPEGAIRLAVEIKVRLGRLLEPSLPWNLILTCTTGTKFCEAVVICLRSAAARLMSSFADCPDRTWYRFPLGTEISVISSLENPQLSRMYNMLIRVS